MAYQSLYRRYRPRRFGEVRGQHQVVEGLRKAVRDERVGHAYLFSGPRGTGKTSTARILAKALNCTDLRDGEPCCECVSCLDVEAGTSYDLVELDAASNNGVNDIRELIKTVALTTGGRTKVYILDEVHMLSPGASNALLKTLEDPPDHVVFVLATTDPDKVLATIRSRTQHFEFHLLPADELADHVRWVIADAELDVSDEGVEQVLRQGGGSARDTLSALDQVSISGSLAESGGQAERLVDAIVDADAGLALRAVAEAVAAGRHPRTLGEDLLSRLRDVFLHRMGDPLDQASEAQRARVMAWAERIGDRATTKALEEVGAALLEMRQAPDPRIPLEVALVRLTRVGTGDDVGALVVRVERLEQELAAVTARAATAPAPTAAPPTGAPSVPPPPPPRPTAAAPAPTPPPPETGEGDGASARPGDAARAALQRSGVPSTSEASPAPPTAAAAVATRDRPLREARTPVPAPSASADDPPSNTGPNTVPNTGPAAPPDRDTLTLTWADAVLPRLGGLTKAMFGVGRFVSVEGSRAVFAVPNDVHRQRCEQKLPEVEAALASHFGTGVTLRLVVEDGPGASDVGSSTPDANNIGPDGSDPDDIDPHDIAGLRDAPADTRTGLDRLNEAFPGSQLLEEEAP